MAAKRLIQGSTRQRPKMFYCPDCGKPAKLFKTIPGGAMRGRYELGHEFPKVELVLR